MADLSGAVDLSEIGKTLGPQESAALQAELRMMAQTRELALRDRVQALNEVDQLERLLTLVVRAFGEANDDPRAGVSIVLSAEDAERVEDVVSLVIEPSEGQVLLLVQLAYEGEWEISDREPSEKERSTLPMYEELPQEVTYPAAQTAIVQTKKGLRIAEWQPE